jgi:hypothetical protein
MKETPVKTALKWHFYTFTFPSPYIGYTISFKKSPLVYTCSMHTNVVILL